MEKPNSKLARQLIDVIKHGYPYRASVTEVLPQPRGQHLVDVLLLDFEIVGICQKPVFDIKPVESIKIEFFDKQNPRVIVLREDFPSVPHLMISKDGKEKWLCYSDVVDEELQLKMNGRFLVECINNWFVKTARNELHHPDQPLEPFFLGSEGVIAINSSFMNKNKQFNKFVFQTPNNVLLQVDDNSDDKNAKWYATLWLELPASADNIIRKIPDTLRELLMMIDSKKMLEIFTLQVNEIFNIRKNPHSFLTIFNQSRKAFLDCNCLIALYIPLYDDRTKQIKKHDMKIFLVDEPFSTMLEMVGIKYNPRTKKYESIETHQNTDASLKLLQLHSIFEPAFARQLNGLNDDSENVQITLIGVGALGSQVFTNCLRAGFGKWTLIDNDVVWMHNLARHALSKTSVGRNKGIELVEYAKSIFETPNVLAIADSIFNHNDAEMSNVLLASDIIVDISTSVAAERVIALDVKSNARRVSAYLNSSGDFLTMLVEDNERNCSLDLLEMQTYKLLCRLESYNDYFNTINSLAYSASCRDITSRISQDVIALSAAIVSKEVKTLTTKNKAEIIIWQVVSDTISAQRHTVESWAKVILNEWQICISEALLEDISSRRDKRLPNETGGVLVGHCDSLRNILYVVDIIPSPNDSIESPNSYIRGCDELPEKMTKISKLTHNNLYYIGEWHSHPSSNTAMSKCDNELLDVITDECNAECRLGCMIIVGADKNYSVHIKIDTNYYSCTITK